MNIKSNAFLTLNVFYALIAGALMAGAFMVLIALTPVSAQQNNQISMDQTIAMLGDQPIKMQEVILAFEALPDQQKQAGLVALYPNLLENVIAFHMLANEGKRAGLAKDPEVLEQVERAQLVAIHQTYIKRLVQDSVGDDQIQSTYNEWRAANPPAEERQARHILLETKAEADAVYQRLITGGEDFATLARSESTGPSAPNGGALGWFAKNQMVKPFEDTAFALEINEISPPFQTQFGWHIAQLQGIRSQEQPNYDQFRNAYLNQQANSIVSEKLQSMAAGAAIIRYDLSGNPIN